ncbi:hypothetical protein [Antarcticimicrobium sediminis]|uniref:Uncharacterized protein n=1 Tax=Antarcticimicrobium sediminis TaxID=2546227 RepID=A0A4R5ENW5_9RHOB|nr:hypothetical protein [Antarcticimicrobium sediminis]TDE36314.1 hypothetical protein E1B25_15510 [Antarcticimicrobium sediminis]
MKLGKLIELAGGSKNDFDGAKRRELLPFKPKVGYSANSDGKVSTFVQHGPYTLADAVLFKVYLDLVRSGMVGKDARAFARAVGSFGHIPRGISKVDHKTPNFLDHAGDDLWIAREVFTANHFSDPRLDPKDGQYFEVKHWAGTRSDIDQFIAMQNASQVEDERQTMSLHIYNLSKSVREVRNKADVLGMVEAKDKGPYRAPAGFL